MPVLRRARKNEPVHPNDFIFHHEERKYSLWWKKNCARRPWVLFPHRVTSGHGLPGTNGLPRTSDVSFQNRSSPGPRWSVSVSSYVVLAVLFISPSPCLLTSTPDLSLKDLSKDHQGVGKQNGLRVV